MSETPETDAAIAASDGQWSFALRDKCQDLERRLNAATRELDETAKDFRCLAELLDGHDATECRANLVKLKRAMDTTDGILAPFFKIARGIPDNWPGECILFFDQRNDGSLCLSYYGVNDASNGITITEWRALLRLASPTAARARAFS